MFFQAGENYLVLISNFQSVEFLGCSVKAYDEAVARIFRKIAQSKESHAGQLGSHCMTN